MTKTLTETGINHHLERSGLMENAHDSGVYALYVLVPNHLPTIRREWDRVHDERPDDLEFLTQSPVAYVGAASDVYERLLDHARGDIRTVTLTEVWPPQSVATVELCDDPFEREFNFATELSDHGWTVWCNGRVVG